jgi:hypothetical protein
LVTACGALVFLQLGSNWTLDLSGTLPIRRGRKRLVPQLDQDRVHQSQQPLLPLLQDRVVVVRHGLLDVAKLVETPYASNTATWLSNNLPNWSNVTTNPLATGNPASTYGTFTFNTLTSNIFYIFYTGVAKQIETPYASNLRVAGCLQEHPHPRSYVTDFFLAAPFMDHTPAVVEAAMRGLEGSGLVVVGSSGYLELRGDAAAVAVAKQVHALVVASRGFMLDVYIRHLVADAAQLEAALALLQYGGLVAAESGGGVGAVAMGWAASVPASSQLQLMQSAVSHDLALACLAAADGFCNMAAAAAQDHNLRFDRRKQEVCTLPTKNNPFANILATDYGDNPHRKPGCDITRRKAKRMTESMFNHNLY